MVQYAYARTSKGYIHSAIKMYAIRQDFNAEAAFYQQSTAAFRRCMPALIEVQPNEHDTICDRFGNSLGPYLVMERGEGLMQVTRWRKEIFSIAKVFHLITIAKPLQRLGSPSH